MPQGLRTLLQRLMLLSVGTGLAATLIFSACQSRIIALFTTDPATLTALRGRLWSVLCLVQPINAAVFVLDGVMYATQVKAPWCDH